MKARESVHITININTDKAEVTLIGSEQSITNALLAALGTHIDTVEERDKDRAESIRRHAVRAITERVV